jgi:phosphate transport system permease protein
VKTLGDAHSLRARRRGDALGRSLTWICGGALALNLLLVAGLLLLLAVNGGAYFWQRDLIELELADGSRVLGEVLASEPAARRGGADTPARINVKVANRDLAGIDFRWIDERDVVARHRRPDAVLLERLEWGNFHGYVHELRRGDEVLAAGEDAVWAAFEPLHRRKLALRDEMRAIERGALGSINGRLEMLRLAERRVAREVERGALAPAAAESRRRALAAETAEAQAEFEVRAERLVRLREELNAEVLVMRAAGGEEKGIAVGSIVHALRPNRLSTTDKIRLYCSRLWGFVTEDPRESNTEGGIFPAIFGTVMMVFLMAIAVVPFGVLAALYLREYAKQGAMVRVVRIAVNNLAGVPSIVFGVFGLGFFVYLVGGGIDRLFFPDALPTPTYGTGGILWAALTLALLTVPVVIVATEEGLAAVPRIMREGSLALGATKWETTWKVVVPAAAPGMLTGLILAMARAAGEVAPLMIVGMVKLAPTLPVDGQFPFVHFERKFMHLGFHIFDVGFQSPNVEATKPLVFATAMLLIAVVTAMNLVAIGLRNHLRRRSLESAV